MPERTIRLLNGNSNSSLTKALTELARSRLPGDVELISETVLDSPCYIGTRDEVVRAGDAICRHAENRYAQTPASNEVLVLACFGDPGLADLETFSPVPVVALFRSACRLAADRYGRFSIVTPGADWPEQMWELLESLGLSEVCLDIDVLPDDATADDPALWRPALEAAVAAAARNNPAAVIVGGATSAGRAQQISAPAGVALLDPLELALGEALETLEIRAGQAGR